ncbi:hypothetical protein J4212_04370 [Candidatus Woesearchaeota archaeon]|nr:hypothetical protein [Candidatus Woesearchaeota archaeon]
MTEEKLRLKNKRIKYCIIGIIFGIFGAIYGFLSYKYNIGESLSGILFVLPYKFYLKVYPILNLCPYDTTSLCAWFGLSLVVFTAPIYYGALGYLIGYIVEKMSKNKK